MHVIIDGYNVIRQSYSLRRYERQSLEAGRKALINLLSAYKRKKDHKITVVFDGWKSGSAKEERDFQSGINIIYSSHGEKADEVIKRLTDQADEEIIVVTSDRGISSYVIRRGKTAISSPEFEIIITNTSAELQTINIVEEKDGQEKSVRYSKKKGPSRRLPRTERNAQAKIKKL